MKKYFLVIVLIAFMVWGYGLLGFDFGSLLLGILSGYLLGMAFE